MHRFIFALLIVLSQPASAASVCSNLILESPQGLTLLHRYEHELKKALFPQLLKFGWKGHSRISVQNMSTPLYRINPQYMIRIDLNNPNPKLPKIILRNKTVQTSLKLDSHPLPELKSCDLVLQARGDEYLVIQKRNDQATINVGDVPTKIYVPMIRVSLRVKLSDDPVKDPTPQKQNEASPSVIEDHASSPQQTFWRK